MASHTSTSRCAPPRMLACCTTMRTCPSRIPIAPHDTWKKPRPAPTSARMSWRCIESSRTHRGSATSCSTCASPDEYLPSAGFRGPVSLEAKVDLVCRRAVEIVTEDEVRELLAKGGRPKAYVGFEPSGMMQIG